ncbi:myophilin-like [Sycon ciliatum]|uniref:myophilin-like n=1 Tax=Sycon ciliatum TaxID=27933 RepID=UPI0031F648FC
MQRPTGYGLVPQTDGKLEEKMDAFAATDIPEKIVSWLNAVLDNPADACKSHDWKDIQEFLKDGTRLCRFMKSVGDPRRIPDMRVDPQTQFACMDNISMFLNAAKEIGVKDDDLFQPEDLYNGEKGPFSRVINTLDQVGRCSLAMRNSAVPQYGA